MAATIDNYELIKLLGEGANGKVYLCRDKNDNNQYAIKVMQIRSPEHAQYFAQMVENEVATLRRLSHPLTVRLIAESANAFCQHSNGQTRQVMYIVMELCPNGELIETLFYPGEPFTEPITRYVFKQILDGLKSVHQEGLVHRDIKPENILFDQEWNIKLADFGFATLSSGREGSGMCQTNLGTPGYKAPEIYTGSPYSGTDADLFACGVILFIMLNHNPPFTEADPKNPYYRRLYGNPASFWKAAAQQKPADYFSLDFMDIVNNMLALEPHNRLTMEQVYAHPWMSGPMATKEEFVGEMLSRHQTVVQQREALAEEARQARGQQDSLVAAVNRGGNEYKSGAHEEIARDMKPYIPSGMMTQFFSTSAPEELWFAIKEYFTGLESCTVTPSEKPVYKFKAEIAKPTGTLCIKANIMEAGDQRAVSITKTTGSTMDLLKLYRELLVKYPFLPDGAEASS